MNQKLNIHDLTVTYGYSPVLRSLNLFVNEGEIVTILGANGAGKTTLLKTISGLLKPVTEVYFGQERIDTLPPEKIMRKGILQVPEGRRIFPGLTVYENLIVPATTWSKRNREMEADLEKVLTLFPRLVEKRKHLGWSLSGGEQQMLAIGRAMMGRPELMLLDEPSLGLAPNLVEDVFLSIQDINKNGITLILVEQNASLALEVATRGYVLETGQITLSGKASELKNDPVIEKAYLGIGK